MRRGTTAIHTITTGIDLTAARLFITYVQGTEIMLDLTSEDQRVTVTSENVVVSLTQADTLNFVAGAPCSLQVRYVFEDGTAGASNVMTFSVEDILKDGEIAFIDPTISISVDTPIEIGSAAQCSVATEPSGIEYTIVSSDDSIAEIQDGSVVGVALGEAVITAYVTSNPNISADCNVTVADVVDVG